MPRGGWYFFTHWKTYLNGGRTSEMVRRSEKEKGIQGQSNGSYVYACNVEWKS